MGRAKVLFITDWYPTQDQPVTGVFVREHAKAAALFDDVAVLHLRGYDRGLHKSWRMEQERSEELAQGIPTYRVWHALSPLPKTSYLLHLWSALQTFRALIRQGYRPDILHANVYTSGIPTLLLAGRYHLPFVVSEHSTTFQGDQLSPLALAAARRVFTSAKVVMPVSRQLKEAIESRGIRAIFQVVPGVVDTALFHPPSSLPSSGACRMLFVGLLDPSHKKGIPYLLQALAQLDRSRSGWRLDIAGDGPARPEYERMAADLGLTGKVNFLGLLPKPQVAETMRQADFFVLPSLRENLPSVIVEAMASGLPVVATRVGGVPELVDEESGLLSPPGDSPALAAALAQMIDRLPEYDREKIARKAQAYEPERVGQMLHSIYHRYV